MILNLSPELLTAISNQAVTRGVAAEVLAEEVLRKHFLPKSAEPLSHDEWMRRLNEIPIDCGVSLPNSALSSDGLYD